MSKRFDEKGCSRCGSADKVYPEGLAVSELFISYYDNDSTIKNAQDTNPNDPDNPNYNREPVYQYLRRRAKKIWVVNDAPSGGPILYVLASHVDTLSTSKEHPVYPQEYKVYYNIFEIRVRCPVAGTPYRVTEFEIGLHG